ncbi:hypothetical protein [Mucilaginibacter myungsuensis]|uniref:Uncharacterized protein n=1 Tax=Mucilaginibacter myungsuensis TaxID=649104 RepID=A0A929PYE9_9SPHI|nr:hypothetical protein [Mucilaginibacter myungsuensis]MBE9663262.1 hypothetical protein [Mucilaginibacter myungsuensis]MDN3598896.1 hypothetical protein [Mucilaginibacter myungsuensis]
MKAIFTTILFLIPLISSAQKSPEKAAKLLGADPIVIIDSVKASMDELAAIGEQNVASILILKDKDAVQAYGPEGNNGAVVVQTKTFARKTYINFFRSVSPKYDSLFNVMKTDTAFRYIINDKYKAEPDAGTLATIDKELFISLTILTDEELKKKYKITDKLIGIHIRSKAPSNLYHKRKKF